MMAMPDPPKPTRKPWGKGNVICSNCGCEYNPSAQFGYVQFKMGTSGDFTVLSTIPKGECPCCRTKQESVLA